MLLGPIWCALPELREFQNARRQDGEAPPEHDAEQLGIWNKLPGKVAPCKPEEADGDPLDP